jgi:sugar lactone lactonase YvrE
MPTLLLDARAELGESPRWSVRDACLYWVDIAAQRLHRFDPTTGTNATRQFDQPVACVAPRASGGLVLGMRDGVAVIDAWDAPLRPLGPPFLADQPDYRCNDATTDAAGNWWLGSVDEAKATHDAALYRIAPDGGVTRIIGGMTTCNGAAFSPDGRTFYHADTPTHAIRAFDHDPATGTLANPRLFHQFAHGKGRPDGAAVDAEGCLWSALFDGGRVVRLSPAGELLATITLPVSRPTMIGFGGDDGRTAFVTSARKGLNDEQLAHEPLVGGLFSFRVQVPGLIAPPFAG